MSWRRLRTLLRREVRATLRDPFTITILIAVPVGSLLLFSFVLSTSVKGLALGVRDQSNTAASRRVVAELAAGGTFVPQHFATQAALDEAIVAGRVSAGVIIPSDFDRDLRRGVAPTVRVMYDGGETVLAGNAEGFLRSLIAATGASLAPPSPDHAGATGVRVVTRAFFNPTLDGTPFMVTGTFGFVLSFLTTLITAVSIVNERLNGTFEQLQVTPATSLEILLAKLIPLGAVFALDVVLMLLVAGFLFGVWPAGSALFFVAVSAFYVLTSLSLGLIFSATSATAAEAVQKTVLFSIPLIQMSGFAFPIRNMPLAFRVIAQSFPATHYIGVTRAIYLRAEGPVALLPELLVLAGYGVVLVALALRSIEART